MQLHVTQKGFIFTDNTVLHKFGKFNFDSLQSSQVIVVGMTKISQ